MAKTRRDASLKESEQAMASRVRTHLLFHSLHGLEFQNAPWSGSSWQPPVDVYEMADAILIQVEAPGLRVDALKLHFEPGQLTVEGTRDRPSLPTAARAVLVEMNYGPFRRRFTLPADVNGDGIHANYEAGILAIFVPRHHQPAKSVRVSVD